MHIIAYIDISTVWWYITCGIPAKPLLSMLNPGGFFFLSRESRMKYEKPPLTFLQQADLLIARGLSADRDTLIARLKAVSYYRLSGYWDPFQSADNSFKEGANLDTVW